MFSNGPIDRLLNAGPPAFHKKWRQNKLPLKRPIGRRKRRGYDKDSYTSYARFRLGLYINLSDAGMGSVSKFGVARTASVSE